MVTSIVTKVIQTTWRHESQQITDAFVAGVPKPRRVIRTDDSKKKRNSCLPVLVNGIQYKSCEHAHEETAIKRWKLIELAHQQKLQRRALQATQSE